MVRRSFKILHFSTFHFFEDFDECTEVGFYYQGQILQTTFRDTAEECFELCKNVEDCIMATFHHASSTKTIQDARNRKCELRTWGSTVMSRSKLTQIITWHKSCSKNKCES